MTKTLQILIGACLAAVLSASPAVAQLNVAATIKPVHALVSAVMAGAGSPRLILGGTVSPHHMALKPSQLRMIQDAAIIFQIGGGLERTLEKSLKQRAEAGGGIVSLIEAPGLTILPVRKAGVWKAHDHDDHAANDPHIWLNPQNASAMAQHIASELSRADPANAGLYRANATRYAARLEALDHELAGQLAKVRDQPFIVFHDAYQYFENRFRLSAAGAITIDPDKRPGARRLQEIRNTIISRNARCVFAEPQFEIAYVTTMIEGTAAQSATLDPIGATLTDSTDAYVELMQQMARAITRCLGNTE